MMSDFEKMITVFNDIGVDYKVITARQEYGKDTNTITRDSGVMWDTLIKITDLYGDNIGYGFYTEFYFLNGEYQKYGIWE